MKEDYSNKEAMACWTVHGCFWSNWSAYI